MEMNTFIYKKGIMEKQKTSPLTGKGEQTRQLILDKALELFASKGYEATTMREIAAATNSSLGLAYRYFSCKEELVLALYLNLAQELETQMQGSKGGKLAERFEYAMRTKLTLLTPHRSALTALFATALNPQSSIGVLSQNTGEVRTAVANVFRLVVTEADDALPPAQIEKLTTVLYSLHLALVFFWIQDRSPESSATYELLGFICDTLKMVRPLLEVPAFSQALDRLGNIIGPFLEGEAKNKI